MNKRAPRRVSVTHSRAAAEIQALAQSSGLRLSAADALAIAPSWKRYRDLVEKLQLSLGPLELDEQDG
jgi:hypothetical protein